MNIWLVKLQAINASGNNTVTGDFGSGIVSDLKDKNIFGFGTWFMNHVSEHSPLNQTLEYLDYKLEATHSVELSNNNVLIDGKSVNEITFKKESLYMFDLTHSSLLNNNVHFEDLSNNKLLNGAMIVPLKQNFK